jgi:hypothetical protein
MGRRRAWRRAQWLAIAQSVKDLEAMLYQAHAHAAAQTLRDCWLERSKLTIARRSFCRGWPAQQSDPSAVNCRALEAR